MKENLPETELNTANKPLSYVGGLTFSAAALLFYGVSLIFGIIILACGLDQKSDIVLYLNYLAAPIGISSAVIAILKNKKMPFKRVFPVKCSPKYYLIGVLMLFGLLFSVGRVEEPILEFFKMLGYEERGSESYFPTLTGWNILPALIVIAVIPALVEETLFRGVILNTCEESLGTVRTIFVVGFCFSLFHGSPEQTVYQFIAGCAFAFVAVRSGSILPSVVMHFLNNALIIVFAALGLYDETGALIMSDSAFIAVTVLSALSFVGATLWLVFDKKPVKKCVKGGVKYFFIYASVGIFVLALAWILAFFITG